MLRREAMEDFNGLAQRVALSADDVHGCLILSRDGLVLGAYPTIDDSVAKSSWLKFARSLGEPDRGFVEFSDQVWVFAKRGAYSSFAVGGRGVRPGVLLETVEQALLQADQSRANHDALRIPDATSAPSGKPRTSLHPSPTSRNEPESQAVPVGAEAVAAEAAAAQAPEPIDAVAAAPDAGEGAPEPRSEPHAEPQPEQVATSGVQEDRLMGDQEPTEDGGEVDRVMLAQEFSGLLQMGQGDDEGSS
jgi:hypothetical protein